jgi:hypothetical protein
LFDVLGGRKGVSDLIFFDRLNNYNGMVLEIKTHDPYYKNGKCKYPEQEEFLIQMRERGWLAEFTVGYQETKKFILEYYDI